MDLNKIAADLEAGRISIAEAAALMREAVKKKTGGRPAKTARDAEAYAWFLAATGHRAFKKTHAYSKLVDRYRFAEERVARGIIARAQKDGRLVSICIPALEPDHLVCFVVDRVMPTLKAGRGIFGGFPRYTLRPKDRVTLGKDFFFFIFKPTDFL